MSNKVRGIIATFVMGLFASLAAQGYPDPRVSKTVLAWIGALVGSGIALFLWPVEKKKP